MEENFNEDICIDTLRFLSEIKSLEEMQHYETLNGYLEQLSGTVVSRLFVCIKKKDYNQPDKRKTIQ